MITIAINPSDAARAEAALDTAGIPHAMGKLTPREVEVITLITHGLSNKEITARLSVSEKTAKSHVSNVLAKLGFSSRVQVALYALK